MNLKSRLLLSAIAMSVGAFDGFAPSYEAKRRPTRRMDLTEDELQILTDFDSWPDQRAARAAKKRYVKELRERHSIKKEVESE